MNVLARRNKLSYYSEVSVVNNITSISIFLLKKSASSKKLNNGVTIKNKILHILLKQLM
jgi:hypothetical protein